VLKLACARASSLTLLLLLLLVDAGYQVRIGNTCIVLPCILLLLFLLKEGCLCT
jgi:hypothetical protein